MKLLIAAALSAASFAASAQVQAPAMVPPIKIGFVRADVIKQQSNDAKEMNARLDAEVTKRRKEIEDMQSQIDGGLKALERDRPTLSLAEYQRRGQDLQERVRILERKKRDAEDDYRHLAAAEYQGLLDRAKAAVRKVGAEDHFDLILADEEIAVYTSSRIDITDRVIQVMNARK